MWVIYFSAMSKPNLCRIGPGWPELFANPISSAYMRIRMFQKQRVNKTTIQMSPPHVPGAIVELIIWLSLYRSIFNKKLWPPNLGHSIHV